MKKIFITGGAGYVGSALADYLSEKNYSVTVYDLFIYGEGVFKNRKKIKLIKGDIRDQDLLKKKIPNHDIVIHLACISNDPSFELNPKLGKSINLDSFLPLILTAKSCGIRRFIYASSSSVYGIKKEKNVNENLELEPLTDYSKFKADCEKILLEDNDENFEKVILRPATVCGYSRRQRLDLVVNILSNHAFNTRKIKILGGNQLRPNIHICDMVEAYVAVLSADKKKVNRQIFNVGNDNFTVNQIGSIVKEVMGEDIQIENISTNDERSYHISSRKIKDILNFFPKYSIKDAVSDLKKAFEENKIPNSLKDSKYYNIKRMQEIDLK